MIWNWKSISAGQIGQRLSAEDGCCWRCRSGGQKSSQRNYWKRWITLLCHYFKYDVFFDKLMPCALSPSVEQKKYKVMWCFPLMLNSYESFLFRSGKLPRKHLVSKNEKQLILLILCLSFPIFPFPIHIVWSCNGDGNGAWQQILQLFTWNTFSTVMLETMWKEWDHYCIHEESIPSSPSTSCLC